MTSNQPRRRQVDPAGLALREVRRVACTAQAQLLRRVAVVVDQVEAGLRAEEAEVGMLLPPELRYSAEQIASQAVDEVAVLLGVSRGVAHRLVDEARAVTLVMPDVLTALEDGRLDPERVTALVRATEHLPAAGAARVAAIVLAGDSARLRALAVPDPGAWDLVTYATWRWRVGRAVARVQTDLADDTPVRVPLPTVQVRVDDALHAELVLTGTCEEVLGAHRLLQEHADAAVPTGTLGPDGTRLRAGEREAAALLGLLGPRSGTGELPATSPPGRRREVGLVLHADAFLDEGPASADPGEVRGSGVPIAVSAELARQMAGRALAAGAGTCLLLADGTGRLSRMFRIGPTPEAGWTRQALVTAGRDALAQARPLTTGSYEPTVAIDEQVRAAHPVSVAPGTGSATPSRSSTVDLDHTVPHRERGPTDVENLRTLHRTPHRRKTRGTWRCRPHDDGTLTWTTWTGATWAYVPEPLPGYATGEAYAAAG